MTLPAASRCLVAAFVAALGWVGPAPAEGAPAAGYSPYANESFPRRLLWGDTHVHSYLSLDANMSGNRRLTPADAFRFARGETIQAHNGMPVRLRRPLDFLVVSDHAEYLGVMAGISRGDPLLLEHETARRWSAALAAGDTAPFSEFAESLRAGRSVLEHPDYDRAMWRDVVAAADAGNQPGRFTAFIGYEWTSMPDGNNLHRVVVFRDGADLVATVRPFSAFDSDDPQDLWAFMARYEAETGGAVLAIPHNSNLSGGLMFPEALPDGSPLTADYAAARARWEPLVEVTQVKGDSETHPFLSPDDEFADYERWDWSNVGMRAPHQEGWFKHEYARAALQLGLRIEATLGVNPYRFGLIGSTDAHTSMATAEEDNYWGKFVSAHPAPERWQTPIVPNTATLPYASYEWQMAASGYAGVWATENTRAAVFNAMRRRETYATTGPRMAVRFFGGWDFEDRDADAPDLARTGYRKGVPMGAVLHERSSAVAPTFLVSALKDPDGANLDRIQIVKGWLDVDGSLHERVHDVAASDGRHADDDGRLTPIASTVSVPEATYRNSAGAAALISVWRDPGFDPALPAFYYVRALEIPTPRWTTYDARAFGLTLPDHVPKVQQERAYTSPIWYVPADGAP